MKITIKQDPVNIVKRASRSCFSDENKRKTGTMIVKNKKRYNRKEKYKKIYA